MKRKIYFFVTLVVVVMGSCKDVDDKISKPEPALPIQPTTKQTGSSQASVTSPEVQDYKDRLHNIVERMNKGFGNVPTTGNPEDDFSKLMITNHFAGIELCELHLKAGQDSILKMVAQKKIAFLKQQEDYFDAYQFNSPSGYRPPVKPSYPGIKHLEISDASDKDAVFAHILSEYNQNTIVIAKDYLRKGTNPSMKMVAQNIIKKFSSELQETKKIMNNHWNYK